MNSRHKKSVDDLTVRIRQIADDQYDGDIECNMLDIFNVLTDEERTVMIRHFMGSQFLFMKGNLICNIKPPVVSEVEKERQDIEKFNKMELIKLKSWLARATLVLGLFFSFLAMVIGGGSIKDYMKDVISVWDSIMG